MHPANSHLMLHPQGAPVPMHAPSPPLPPVYPQLHPYHSNQAQALSQEACCYSNPNWVQGGQPELPPPTHPAFAAPPCFGNTQPVLPSGTGAHYPQPLHPPSTAYPLHSSHMPAHHSVPAAAAAATSAASCPWPAPLQYQHTQHHLAVPPYQHEHQPSSASLRPSVNSNSQPSWQRSYQGTFHHHTQQQQQQPHGTAVATTYVEPQV